jgi:hypothetical protein
MVNPEDVIMIGVMMVLYLKFACRILRLKIRVVEKGMAIRARLLAEVVLVNADQEFAGRYPLQLTIVSEEIARQMFATLLMEEC